MLTRNPFEGKNEINIVYLGGSITEGYKSSGVETCYVGLCSDWFKDKFPSITVNNHNMGVGGTGSNFGMVRMDRDVLSKNPDMLFVEFAVNDGNGDSRATMESIVRKTLLCENVPYIVFLYTANKTYSVEPKYHQEIADYYGIPTINLQDVLKEKTGGADPVEMGLFLDGVHPLDGGFKIYADAIIEKLEKDNFYARPQNKEPLMKECVMFDAQFVPSTKYSHSEGWTEKTGHRGYEGLFTEKAGETITFEFDGNYLAIEAGLHKESALLEVYVDGELVKTLSYYYNMVAFQTNYQSVTHKLSLGHHTVTIKTKEETNEAHPGTTMMVYHIITGTAK